MNITAQLLKKLTLVRVMNFQYQIHIVYSEFVLCASSPCRTIYFLWQVWLYNKIEAAKQARLNQPDPEDALRAREEKESNAQSAYSEWLSLKRQQDKTLRQLEERRREEEASQYTIRDRQLCDEAFRRWVKIT